MPAITVNPFDALSSRIKQDWPVAAFVAAVLAASISEPAHADQVTPPAVPDNIQVPTGNKAFLMGHAEGTQNYICLPSGDSVKYALYTPQATLFGDDGKESLTHSFSPNPYENPPPAGQYGAGTFRATWQHARDSSVVWGKVEPSEMSSDPQYVRPGAIPWLLIRQSGVQRGPTGGATLMPTTFIHRVNTVGGVAPSTGCASSMDVGNKAFVPYSADYYFYRIQ